MNCVNKEKQNFLSLKSQLGGDVFGSEIAYVDSYTPFLHILCHSPSYVYMYKLKNITMFL